MQAGTVLIVEDDPDIRESMRIFLEDEGYAVVEAADGRAGLMVLRQSRQGLVVLVDYRMPRMDGIEMLTEVAKHARLAQSNVYVLVTANYDQLPSSCAPLLAVLRIESVRKPFDLEVLLEAVVRANDALSQANMAMAESGEMPGDAGGRSSMQDVWQALDPPRQHG